MTKLQIEHADEVLVGKCEMFQTIVNLLGAVGLPEASHTFKSSLPKISYPRFV